MLDVAQGQPGFVALAPVRQSGDRPAVATFEITVEDRHKGDKGLIVDELIGRRRQLDECRQVRLHPLGD